MTSIVTLDVDGGRMILPRTEKQQQGALDLLGYHNHPQGQRPGGFRETLFTLWAKGDPGNKARLAGAFPELSVPVAILTQYGIDSLAQYATTEATNA